MIRELIRLEFGVKLSEVSVGRPMKRLDVTPQCPLYRAWQQNPALVESWLEMEFSKIAAHAKREKALIILRMNRAFDPTIMAALVRAQRVYASH